MEPLNLTQLEIEWAINNSRSNLQAANLLKVNRHTFKKYALFYNDDNGVPLYYKHFNNPRQGIIRSTRLRDKLYKQSIYELMKNDPNNTYAPDVFKERLFSEGILLEQCEICGHNERRIIDDRVPLVISFRDGNRKNWEIENLEVLCYNCYFLTVGDLNPYDRQMIP